MKRGEMRKWETRPADEGERRQGGQDQEGPEETEGQELGMSQAGGKRGWGGAGPHAHPVQS